MPAASNGAILVGLSGNVQTRTARASSFTDSHGGSVRPCEAAIRPPKDAGRGTRTSLVEVTEWRRPERIRGEARQVSCSAGFDPRATAIKWIAPTAGRLHRRPPLGATDINKHPPIGAAAPLFAFAGASTTRFEDRRVLSGRQAFQGAWRLASSALWSTRLVTIVRVVLRIAVLW